MHCIAFQYCYIPNWPGPGTKLHVMIGILKVAKIPQLLFSNFRTQKGGGGFKCLIRRINWIRRGKTLERKQKRGSVQEFVSG